MKERNKKIVAELIQFQTVGFQCKGLINYLVGEGDTGDKFIEFQNHVFSIVDKINKEDFSFTAKDVIFINNIKKLIIERYKQESLIAQIIRGDDLLNDVFDKKIIEIHDLFSDLKN